MAPTVLVQGQALSSNCIRDYPSSFSRGRSWAPERKQWGWQTQLVVHVDPFKGITPKVTCRQVYLVMTSRLSLPKDVLWLQEHAQPTGRWARHARELLSQNDPQPTGETNFRGMPHCLRGWFSYQVQIPSFKIREHAFIFKREELKGMFEPFLFPWTPSAIWWRLWTSSQDNYS